MRDKSCLSCGQHLSSLNRDRMVRQIALQLSRSATYPLIYRLIDQLRLCARCVQQLPLIGEAICEVCGRAFSAGTVCGDCSAAAGSPLESNRSLLRYNEWGKQLLSRFKYRGDERLAAFFAHVLALAYVQHYHDEPAPLLTYVPLHAARLEQRGFNQVELIADQVGRLLRLPVRPLLSRVKQTDKLSLQTGRASRRESMRDAFAFVPPPRLFRPDCVVIIDDIYTTGSTLRSCAAAIQEQHACRILGLTIYR